MSNPIAYQTGDLWSVVDSSRVWAYLQPYADVAALLTSEGLDSSKVLVSAPAEQFYPTLLAALEFTTDGISQTVQEHVARYGGDELHERIDTLNLLFSHIYNNVAVIAADIKRQEAERERQAAEAAALAAERARKKPIIEEWRSLEAEIKELEIFLASESLRLGIKVDSLSSTRQHKRLQQVYQRVAELNEALQ